MKKLVSLILALAMGCLMIPALAEEDITGEWYASLGGMVMHMTLNADGTMAMEAPGQEGAAAGTWTREGDQVTLTVDGSPATATVTAEGLSMAEGGMELLFTREKLEPITVAEIKPDAAAEEFYGEWKLTYMEADGMIMDPSVTGMTFPNVKLGEGTVEFIAAGEEDVFALIFGALGLTSTYADGALTLTATTEGVTASGKVEMLADGMIKVTLDNDGSLMVLYYSPVEAAAEPAA